MHAIEGRGKKRDGTWKRAEEGEEEDEGILSFFPSLRFGAAELLAARVSRNVSVSSCCVSAESGPFVVRGERGQRFVREGFAHGWRWDEGDDG